MRRHVKIYKAFLTLLEGFSIPALVSQVSTVRYDLRAKSVCDRWECAELPHRASWDHSHSGPTMSRGSPRFLGSLFMLSCSLARGGRLAGLKIFVLISGVKMYIAKMPWEWSCLPQPWHFQLDVNGRH
jgi:hypothetical protein